ncbi:MAG TPA: histidine kinase N-terminal 7TM domain-containing protein, partial [Vicinamibacteria bacterium]|nr:histidine kinase N-terminal 7TM domain-containing protein [Vicinamibacteria bacterium]
MPSWESLLSYLAAGSAFFLGALVFSRERGKLAYAAFALGMTALAVREILSVQALESVLESQALRWHRYRFATEAVIPGLWLLFALTFARADPGRFVRLWRWPLAASFLVPLGIVGLGWDSLIRRTSYPVPNWLVPIGLPGLWLHAALLLSAVAILVNLENTLRSAVGSVRWQIKFTVLGIGVLFGVQLF